MAISSLGFVKWLSDDLMMHKIILLFLGLLGCVGMGVAQISQLGQCESIDLMNNFVLDSFLGTWYEVGKASTQNAACSSWVFTNNAAGFTVNNPSVVNNFLQTATGTATHTTGSAQLTLTMSSSNTPINFGILATDYDNYAIAIECVNLGDLQRSVNLWQLGRATNSYDTAATLQLANTALGTIGLSVNSLESIDHSAAACTQLPVIPTGQPIILPGQCNNNNINVVPNFQVGDFLGTWYEISSYYSVNAEGTCARADYTLGESAVDVLNSQVLNQRLDTITGTASQIGVDGRLNGLLNIQGVPVPVAQELLILDTDYDGYAVSYTCVNLPDNQRQVNSWILSRTRQISAASETEVDRVINSYVDLNTAYYQPTAQTDDACFYYPEAVLDLPVVFPGQCDESISAMNSFNMASFAGQWYEIQAYPKEQQTGTCVNHEFTSVAGNAITLNLVSNQVVNQFATSASGSVSFESTDGTGKLRLNMIVNGQPINFPYWILSTDYTSYALVYSCSNIDANYRSVHSWKLSRSQTLPPAAAAPINTAMAAVQVLEEEYFQPINQNADSCLTLPVIPAGQPIILPGQCNNNNMNVVQNFQVGDFLGTWYEISSYYSVNADGTCARADYTLGESAVDVLNSQVLNQRLDTITGTASQIGTEGRLNVLLNIQGVPVPVAQELLILDTDYDGYAVSYTCVNLPDNQRQVNSWILSRSRQITPASQTEVDRVINSYVDLNTAYYQPTAQTDDACFYYPEAVLDLPVVFPGQCDESISAMNSFNMASFAGQWYEVQAYPKEQQTGTCVNHEFTAIAGNANTLNLVSNQVVNQFATSASGSVSFESTDGTGKLRLNMIVNGQPINFPYWILSTDYTSYALVYSCSNIDANYRSVHSWKLSRSQTLPPAAAAPINTAMAAVQVLEEEYFQPINQNADSCLTLPVIPAGQPIILPGQCNNNNMNVVQNFQVGDFLGTWYEISSYYSVNADGTCARADYTLGESAVDVLNSQVLNQRLDTITGTASQIGTEGRLNVLLNIQGVPVPVAQELLILDTDYDGYAVSYTCVNLPDNQRQVNSWILSRSRQITPASQTEVDRVINSYVDLNTAYYQPTAQTDDACFYYPEAVLDLPVVFPGQCDESISAMNSFNMASFAGQWYEVQAYPKEQQTGTCVNHEFTSVAGNANTLNLVSNQVVNQFATSASGSVSFESTDGTGKLRLNMIVNGQPINFPYWILSTDYTSYALVYSCSNIDANYRSVHSWKLSRSQTLPPAAAAPINTAMAAVQVLEEEYFQPINQNADSCLTLPVIPAGQPIILPGQCNNNNMNVVQNFQVGDFLGTWYEISSYYSVNADGTCARADYTLGESAVDVLNSQVLNQRLDTITGTASQIGTEGRLNVLLNIQGVPVPVAQELLILDTDYDGYAVSYTCVNLPDNQRQVNSWILSRSRQITPASQTEVDRVINSYVDLNTAYYQPTAQTDDACFYYPEAVLDLPVVFPGQCDESISAMNSFNMASFAGQWYEIQAYPKEQQTGTCVNHEFTAIAGNANTLNLVSNQVVNQFATSASGSVSFESTDGTGKLRLNMIVNGQPINFPYWILSTDYTSYALVYSCSNIDANYRSVHSWKLSRTQTLPPAAAAPINTAMAAVQVLEEEYFQPIDQNADSCLTLPVIPAGQPIILPGQCNNNNINVVQNFQVGDFLGTWYEISSYYSVNADGTCARADYTLGESAVDVLNSQVLNQRLDTITGTASQIGTEGRLNVLLNIQGIPEPVAQELLILDTDYNGYAVSYTCVDLPNNQRQVNSWILSRSRQITPVSQTEVDRVINSYVDLNTAYYQPTAQTDDACFYYPEAVTGLPVVFPGQCDESISAMNSFNMASFAGVWHEVEAYPKVQQTGTCVNHEFTAVAGNTNTLNLVSNQVVSQFVISNSGSVTFESTDGSGKLRLNMIVNGQNIEIPYWILNTDYENYALVYSCINIDADYRSVHAWKLSKTQTLLPAAIASINAAMVPVQVLEQEYFDPIDQSAPGCFTHPNIPEGDPIILPGQCQPVSPVTGFQSGAFGGTWYEVARYASERQTGDCAASQFTATPQNTFTLTQTIVYNERQTVVSGTATLDADGSGVLTATLSDGDQLTYTTTMYILDTDYDSFALLYSCDNLPGTTNRQLYSWQLSRSQSGLSQEAKDRISELIANNEDLIQNYYQPIGQTSSDCFYYPVFEETPDSVILPGTCPEISGKAGFEPGRYLNNWYEVARYPIESQFGTCSRAEYNVDDNDGVVNIRNTMVVDGRLVTQFGTASVAPDGTGKLDVTFVLDNGDEVYATYYILETDYESFSLVYSCRNLTDETREVYSWKLSRTPELNQAAIDAIQTVIDNTEGLLEDFYVQTNQTAQDCFYVPEPVPGKPVLFRGACEPVNAMINFNPTEYLGWWHEIERYPTDNDFGQCASAEFIQTGNAIQVTQTSIDGGVHNETISTAVLSNDATITITRDEWPTVWTVLDTDYNTYALLYACENVDTDWGVSRRVWSAKHSKLRSLSAEAQEAMNSAIADTPVLDQDLYENVNQSYSACFHYREEAGPQVILDGPCDTGIDFQTDFDVSRFAGRWFQHERYPYPQVSDEGTCVGTRYTVNGDNINVQNWEVLNGTLNTIDGTATANAETATLTVTLEGTAEPMNLRILITDYENYALAYTCTDIGLYRRSVGAFKLSRHRELTSESQNAIDTYMQNRDEFYSSYFITIEQNADCPEPSSAFLVKSSIIVMLFCIALQLVM